MEMQIYVLTASKTVNCQHYFPLQFAVVKFSSEAVVLGSTRSCVSSYTLSEATPLNIKFFEAEINRLTIRGATNYEAALDTAFRFFESSNSSINGEKRGTYVNLLPCILDSCIFKICKVQSDFYQYIRFWAITTLFVHITALPMHYCRWI